MATNPERDRSITYAADSQPLPVSSVSLSSLSSSVAAAVYGQSVTFTVTVAATPLRL